MMRRYLTLWNLILLSIFVVLFLFVIYPMFSIFYASFLSPETGKSSLESYQKIFSLPFYMRCLRNSLWVSALATVISLILGVPFAFFTSRFHL
ncbi:MAG: iron ABC transporter permease, partial [Thermodesulfobacteriota bacterium]|nr:iron ABC transporter permease [Thermodesulfobacteriota bacterium]